MPQESSCLFDLNHSGFLKCAHTLVETLLKILHTPLKSLPTDLIATKTSTTQEGSLNPISFLGGMPQEKAHAHYFSN